MTVAYDICDKIYDKVSRIIYTIPIANYIINSTKGDYSDSMLEAVESRINSSDLVIYNEIAPVEYSDYQRLLIYNLLNTSVESKTSFIIVSNNSSKQIIKNLGPLLTKYIMSHNNMIQI